MSNITPPTSSSTPILPNPHPLHPLHDPHHHSLSHNLQPFIVGGLSAMFASSCIHPIDLSKVRLQLFATLNPGQPKPSSFKILSEMISKDGFSSIYSGLSASLMRQAVYGTARIGLHRTFSEKLQEQNQGKPLSFFMKTGAGMSAGALAVCLGTPFDVALVRMQADSMKEKSQRRGYKNVFNALGRIYKEEGFNKLYSGLIPNVLRGMAVNVGMLACYDQALEIIAKEVTKDANPAHPSLNTQLLASLIAGFTASAFSLPFDLLKSRLQDGAKYKNIGDAVSKVLKNEGILAFWTGFSAYYLRTAPHAMIILMTQQPLKDLYHRVAPDSEE